MHNLIHGFVSCVPFISGLLWNINFLKYADACRQMFSVMPLP